MIFDRITSVIDQKSESRSPIKWVERDSDFTLARKAGKRKIIAL